jgi:predicted metal-dependent hydrolase
LSSRAPASDRAQICLPFVGDELVVVGSSGATVFARHPRARRYILRVEDDGSVRVTLPRWGSRREALAFVEHERAWIAKQRQRLARQRADRARATNPPWDQSDMAREARARATQELPSRLLALATEHGLSVRKVSVRNQKRRWGSCSPSGHICLNWRLVLMPDGVRDYVLIHELMHLRRLDHSPAFWKLVAKACPAYREHRAFLRRRALD